MTSSTSPKKTLEQPNISTDNKRVAIVGAGPAGLATARALQAFNIDYLIFERNGDVGGIWDFRNPGSPMYESAHFISSKTMSGHFGFPMPEEYPDYPSNKQIHRYIQQFADVYGIQDKIEFNTSVLEASHDGEMWHLRIQDGEGKEQDQTFDWLVCANGTNWHKNQPELKGQENFTGDIIHSVEYQSSESLKGQRVLVVGAGNSGVDIACDAAYTADEAYISLRRGYHFVPKHIMGQPADVFGSGSDWLPTRIQQMIFGGLLRLINGDLSRLGLQKPDHKVLSSHPIMNTQILHYLQHGDLHAKPDIASLSGKKVTFVDGSSIEVDKIILATGYQWKLPFLSDNIFQWKSNRPQTYMKIFNPKHPTLFLNGFIETNGGAYKLFDDMGLLIAQAIRAQKECAQEADKLQNMIIGPEPILGGSVQYVESDRHQGYTNSNTYKDALAKMRKQLGWSTPQHVFESVAQQVDKKAA